ncbi:polysaccharide lyase [Thalassospira sp.]|uniref:polysaccharide lyase n=1 Tax=Thalassospira sp. TaxID=1912094 RepID=UPI002736A32F|nr:polysaccharide lyase [Thalassospira sp.]MDP2698209.1 polysaccharide lyase [Thalassospira sp.]
MRKISFYGGVVAILALGAFGADDVDRGTFGPFVRSLNDTDYGYRVVSDPTGSAIALLVERFEVRAGDCGGPTGIDCGRDRERSELSERGGRNPAGSTYWYGWSIYFPDDFRNVYPTKVALGQFHQEGAKPAWMFQNDRGGYHLDDHVTGTKPRYRKLIDESDLRGTWHRIEVQAKWSRHDDGFLKIWVNGDQKVDYAGPTMTADKIYFKYGVYRSYVSRYQKDRKTDKVPAQTVLFANVRRADTRQGLGSAPIN